MVYDNVKEQLIELKNKENNEEYYDALDCAIEIVDKYDKMGKVFRDYQWDELDKDMAFRQLIEIIATIPKRYWKQK